MASSMTENLTALDAVLDREWRMLIGGKVVDQFDQLYADGESAGRVMALCLHPFIVNQPFRHPYLDRALAYIAGHDRVWLTTSDDIAEHYAQQRAAQPADQAEPA